MADTPRLLNQLRRLAAAGDGPATDAGLLRLFAATADQAAFAELVRRHGPTVLGVCRRVLGNPADADDAFQAAFLVLARKAGSIRKRGSVGGWLYGVARHVAVRLRDKNARRRRHERVAAATRSECGSADPDGDELRAVLDEELARLPERERAAVLSCLVRGLTQEQAAAELGWSLSTVRRRIDRGQELLRVRLARRLGVVSAGMAAGGTVIDGVAVAVAPGLAGATIDGAVSFAAGAVMGTPAGLLATGELAMLTRMKLAVVAGAVTVVTGVAIGAGAVWPAAQADDPKPAAKAKPPAKAGPPAAAKPPDQPAVKDVEDRIKPGDRLNIVLPALAPNDPPVSGVIRVEPTGKVHLGADYGGRVRVAGFTLDEVEKVVRVHLAEVMKLKNLPAVAITRADPEDENRGHAGRITALEVRVQQLEEQVAELKKALDEMRKK